MRCSWPWRCQFTVDSRMPSPPRKLGTSPVQRAEGGVRIGILSQFLWGRRRGTRQRGKSNKNQGQTHLSASPLGDPFRPPNLGPPARQFRIGGCRVVPARPLCNQRTMPRLSTGSTSPRGGVLAEFGQNDSMRRNVAISDRFKSLIEIGHKIVDVFNASGVSNQSLGDSERSSFGLGTFDVAGCRRRAHSRLNRT